MSEISIGELSCRTGVAVSALHFYERKGLITARRTRANHRVYPRSAIRLVTVIQIAQRAGLSLGEIAEALAPYPSDRALSVQSWDSLSSAWRDALDARISLLTRLRDTLSSCIGCGCLSLESCPLANEGDRLAALGPGAHIVGPDMGGEPG